MRRKRLTRDGMLTAALVVVALFVGSAVEDLVPDATDLFETRFSVHAHMDEPAVLRTGIVTVTDVRSSSELSYFGDIAATNEIFLVLDLTWRTTVAEQPMILDAVRFEAADGTRFGGQPAFQSTCTPAQPGFDIPCHVHFEVPPAKIAGGRLIVPTIDDIDETDSVAVIDLGLTGDLLEDLLDPEDRLDVTPEERTT